MHPTDCPTWEYKNDPRHAEILKTARSAFLIALRFGAHRAPDHAVDTRGIHHSFFRMLAPPLCPYFAGHYRGERYRCLQQLKVGVHADRRVGYPAMMVAHCMERLGAEIRAALDAFDLLTEGEAKDKNVKKTGDHGRNNRLGKNREETVNFPPDQGFKANK